MSLISKGTMLTIFYEDGSRRVIRPFLGGIKEKGFERTYDNWRSLAESISLGSPISRWIVS